MWLRQTVPGFVFPAERVCPAARPRAPDGNERARSPRCNKYKTLRVWGFSGWIKRGDDEVFGEGKLINYRLKIITLRERCWPRCWENLRPRRGKWEERGFLVFSC